ncbi:nucleotidyltransferase family protein [Catenovulum sediminis]|uniref:Nucleotidyltransferase domain-containing protein n=1 Tax=Catenovulum sediminis TaxID=1740262 RepID=A0ABV1RKM1_9ALTE
MINITAAEKQIIEQIIKQSLPDNVQVYVFGSRTKNQNRQYSDLDIVLKCDKKVSPELLINLKEEFMESDLPFRVDITDWHRLSESFKPCIEKDLIQIH